MSPSASASPAASVLSASENNTGEEGGSSSAAPLAGVGRPYWLAPDVRVTPLVAPQPKALGAPPAPPQRPPPVPEAAVSPSASASPAASVLPGAATSPAAPLAEVGRPFLLAPDDRVTRPMSKKKAHEKLAQFRGSMAANGRIIAESRDLSDGVDFDWKAYVTSRPDHRQVIGVGIWKFECRFLAAKDPNAKVLPVPNRFDFIAHRLDGSAVRLHPERVQHGEATEGQLGDWALRGGDAFLPAAPPAAAMPRNDTVGAMVADVWLHEHMSEPTQEDLDEVSASSRDQNFMFYRNITHTEEFPWRQFLAARPWGLAIVDDVAIFGAAWWIRGNWTGPVFIATMGPHAREHANESGVIRCNGERAKISWPQTPVRYHGQ